MNDAQSVVDFIAQFLFNDVLNRAAGARASGACASEIDVDEVFFDIDDFDVAAIGSQHRSDIFFENGFDALRQLLGRQFHLLNIVESGIVLNAPVRVE